MDGLHLADGTSEVYSTIDNMVMQLGNIIQVQSVRLSRQAFERWVQDELPFDIFTARRLRAISLAHQELPEEMLEEMPPPWRALFVGP
jgi:hypothetical protein